jgi:hypothetical protein
MQSTLLLIIILLILSIYLDNKAITEGFVHTNDMTYNPENIKLVKHKPQKVLVFHSVAYTKNPDYMKHSTKINKHYCDKWGYDFKIINHKLSEMPPYWLRVKDLISLLNTTKYDIICYIDIDAIFYDHSLSIQDVFSYVNKTSGQNYDMILGDERHSKRLLNTGFFLVKNTQWIKNLAKTWFSKCIDAKGKLIDVCKPWKYNNKTWTCENCTNTNGVEKCVKCSWASIPYEQGCLEDMFNDNILDSQKHIGVLPKLFMSNNSVRQKSYILHLMGKKTKVTANKVFSELSKQLPFT